MSADYLHNHPEFADLIRIVAEEKGIDPALVEKDYWIMHSLFGLQQLKLKFELKGGTSLSKGHGMIDRFSEDIDIRIEPPAELHVKTGRNHTKGAHVESRRKFYDWLSSTIKINGIDKVERDRAFDNKLLFSGGIRLFYKSVTEPLEGLKTGVLLEAGFDVVTPNTTKDISSWAYDYAAAKGVKVIDNRAKGVACYDPGHTLVEKLQTISTKYRQWEEKKEFPVNFMRHYYDVYCLLERPEVQAFIGTDAYKKHKETRFRRGDNRDIPANQAFMLSDPKTRKLFGEAYDASKALYYGAKPSFDEILKRIADWSARL